MSQQPIKGIAEEKYFRWRGKEVSRTENLSDIVFAMALTLIVASSVPSSFAELTGLWREGIAIGLCFTILLLIWRIHFVFFRRYDLEDRTTMVLNSILIFLIMIFAYPLKFLAMFLVNYFTEGFPALLDIATVLSLEQAPWLTAIYSIGYGVVYAVFAAMYAHAAKRADDIGLNQAERVLTTAAIHANLVHVGFAGFVVLLTQILPDAFVTMAGFFFVFLRIPLSILGNKAAKKAKAAFVADAS
ncbi:MAG: hypothetical protein COA47_11525 [Robiginitomaculum sp.]|nr:MAG: hypothetical protein COA47_11525 [Robiginitomaculum sp.]